jgi:membrane fusion protein (multidrug efflux system)
MICLFAGLVAAAAEERAGASVALEGLVTPELLVELASPSEGLVQRVLVREGDEIEEGTAIAELFSEEEKIRLRLAELQSRKLNEDLNAMKRLYKENAASRDDYTRAMLSAEQAAAERDLALIRMQERTIVSPTSGYVRRLLKDSGESVRRLETFAEIANLGRMHVTVFVPAEHLGHLPRGSPALVYPGGEDDQPLAAEVELADPVLDPGGEVFRVKLLVREPGERLKAGTRVKVEFPTGS